jgi:hypothetical protein
MATRLLLAGITSPFFHRNDKVFNTKLYESNGEIETKRKIICPFSFLTIIWKNFAKYYMAWGFFPFQIRGRVS